MRTGIRVGLFAAGLALALPAGAMAQQRGGPPPVRKLTPPLQQRDALERRIIQRFVERTGDEMKLGERGRNELERILRESNGRRRELVAASRELRQRLRQAIDDPDTPDATFEALLDEAEGLQRQEHELFERDQEEIARTLTPRQRAVFMVRWIGLQEQVQELIEARSRDRQDGGIYRW